MTKWRTFGNSGLMKRLMLIGLLLVTLLTMWGRAATFPTPQKAYLDTVGNGLKRTGNTVDLVISNSTATWTNLSPGVWQLVTSVSPTRLYTNGAFFASTNIFGLVGGSNTTVTVTNMGGVFHFRVDAGDVIPSGLGFALRQPTNGTVTVGQSINFPAIFNAPVTFNSDVTNNTVINQTTIINNGTIVNDYSGTNTYLGSFNLTNFTVYTIPLQYITNVLYNYGTLTLANAGLIATNSPNIGLPFLTYTNGGCVIATRCWDFSGATVTGLSGGGGGSGGGDTNAATITLSNGTIISNGLIWAYFPGLFPTNFVSGSPMLMTISTNNRIATFTMSTAILTNVTINGQLLASGGNYTISAGDGLTTNNVRGLIGAATLVTNSDAVATYFQKASTNTITLGAAAAAGNFIPTGVVFGVKDAGSHRVNFSNAVILAGFSLIGSNLVLTTSGSAILSSNILIGVSNIGAGLGVRTNLDGTVTVTNSSASSFGNWVSNATAAAVGTILTNATGQPAMWKGTLLFADGVAGTSGCLIYSKNLATGATNDIHTFSYAAIANGVISNDFVMLVGTNESATVVDQSSGAGASVTMGRNALWTGFSGAAGATGAQGPAGTNAVGVTTNTTTITVLDYRDWSWGVGGNSASNAIAPVYITQTTATGDQMALGGTSSSTSTQQSRYFYGSFREYAHIIGYSGGTALVLYVQTSSTSSLTSCVNARITMPNGAQYTTNGLVSTSSMAWTPIYITTNNIGVWQSPGTGTNEPTLRADINVWQGGTAAVSKAQIPCNITK